MHSLYSKHKNDKSMNTSEYWCERSLQMCSGKQTRFDINSENLLEEWLQSNKQLEQFSKNRDGFARIYDSVTEEEDYNTEESYLDKALEIWQDLTNSKVPIMHNIIQHIALKYRILPGSWVCFVKGGAKVDKIWRTICTRYKNDKFNGYVTSSVLSPVELDNENHAIFISNKNYTDMSAVLALEGILRETGITCSLFYKPDINFCFRIYRNNKWNIQPTIFKSVYDIKAKKSFITDTHNECFSEKNND